MSDTTKPADATNPADRRALFDLVERAQKGDESALPELRKWLQTPAVVDMLGGDLAYQAERSLLDNAAGKNLSFRESALRKLELMRAELAGSAPTPLERLLVQRIVACWLQLYYTTPTSGWHRASRN